MPGCTPRGCMFVCLTQRSSLFLGLVCWSSGSSSAPRFRTGEAGAMPNDDFDGAASEHLQEEPEPFFTALVEPQIAAPSLRLQLCVQSSPRGA